MAEGRKEPPSKLRAREARQLRSTFPKLSPDLIEVYHASRSGRPTGNRAQLIEKDWAAENQHQPDCILASSVVHC